MGISVKPYVKGDVFAVKIRKDDPLGGDIRDYKGPAWTMFIDNNPVACVGIQYARNGVGTWWAFISDEARGHGIALLKNGRRFIKGAFDNMDLHRIEATVRADRPEYQRWIELFGFQQEGYCRQASADGRDIILYARLKDDE